MDVNSVSIALGLVVSLAFTELFGLAAGGMVVPGYIALYLDKPLCILTTIAAAIATWLIVKSLSKVMIVYGKRRTLLMILVGFLLGAATRVVPAVFAGEPDLSAALAVGEFAAIGFIIPGLIAIWIDRQGLLETVGAVLTTGVVVRLALILVAGEMLA